MAKQQPWKRNFAAGDFDPPRRQLDAETVECASQTDYYRHKLRK
jgi:hypothetical protein